MTFPMIDPSHPRYCISLRSNSFSPEGLVELFRFKIQTSSRDVWKMTQMSSASWIMSVEQPKSILMLKKTGYGYVTTLPPSLDTAKTLQKVG